MSKIEKDLQFIEEQLGRSPRGVLEISARCKSGHPLVIKTKPVLGNKIFPTLYYLVCCSVIDKVSNLESASFLSKMQQRVDSDNSFKAHLLIAQKEYRKERNALIDTPLNESQKEALNGGIGGVKKLHRIKCLHCHLAHYLARRDNPVGEAVYNELIPSNCLKIPPNLPLEKGGTTCKFPLSQRGIKGDLCQ